MRGVLVVLAIAGLIFAAPVYADEAAGQGTLDGQESAVVTYVTQELRDKCTGCHSIGRVLSRRLDRAGWTTVVWLEMRPKQPQMYAAYYEAEPLIDFLADRYVFLAGL